MMGPCCRGLKSWRSLKLARCAHWVDDVGTAAALMSLLVNGPFRVSIKFNCCSVDVSVGERSFQNVSMPLHCQGAAAIAEDPCIPHRMCRLQHCFRSCWGDGQGAPGWPLSFIH